MKRIISIFTLAALASSFAFPAAAVFKPPERKCEEFLNRCLMKAARAQDGNADAPATSAMSGDTCYRAFDFAKANGSWPDTSTQMGGICKP